MEADLGEPRPIREILERLTLYRRKQGEPSVEIAMETLAAYVPFEDAPSWLVEGYSKDVWSLSRRQLRFSVVAENLNALISRTLIEDVAPVHIWATPPVIFELAWILRLDHLPPVADGKVLCEHALREYAYTVSVILGQLFAAVSFRERARNRAVGANGA